MYELVGLGGCFDHLHTGHKELINTAFKVGNHVAIAITTGELQQDKQCKEQLQSYELRAASLKNYIETTLQKTSEQYSLIPLHDPFGPAITNPKLQAHVSSMETYKIAMKINEIRIERGLPPLVLIIIPLVLNDEGNKIASTDIRIKICENPPN